MHVFEVIEVFSCHVKQSYVKRSVALEVRALNSLELMVLQRQGTVRCETHLLATALLGGAATVPNDSQLGRRKPGPRMEVFVAEMVVR